MALTRKVLAGLAAAIAATPASASQAGCHVEIAGNGPMAAISAYVTAPAPTEGDYVMDTEVRAGGNRSMSRQAGKFQTADAEAPVLLARSVVGRNSSSEIRVHVTLSTAGGTIECGNDVQ